MSGLHVVGTSLVVWGVCALISPNPAAAQVGSGQITGTVYDEQKSVIPGATIKVTQVRQGITKTAETNQEGIYVVEFLPVGPYTVEVSAPGFRRWVQTGLTLTVNQVMRVDAVLQVGTVEQQIEVHADASQALRLETAEIGQVINHQQVADLPLNGRDFADLIRLVAGVNDGMQNQSNSGYNINGSRSDNNMFVINGVDNLDHVGNLNVRPPIDAIEEFAVQTSTFSAEYGRTAGGIVAVQLKSGTNEVHGSGFWFLRNEILDANGFFDNQVALAPGQAKAPRQPLRRNQFGGTLGGPVVRNTAFFFIDYQGTRDRLGGTTIQSVPTELERQGDFSETLPPGQPLFENALLGTIFEGQRIPPSAIDPAAAKIAQMYPLPNQPGTLIPGRGTINNYSTSGTRSVNSDQFDVKIDYQISTRDSLTAHYSFVQGSSDTPAAFGGGTVGPCIDCGVVLDLLAGTGDSRAQNGGITHVHTFNPHTVNELRIGLNRNSFLLGTSDGGQNLADQVGIPNVNIDELTVGLPWFFFSSGPSWIGTSPFTPNRTAATAYQLSENLSRTKGRHTLKFGFDFRRRHINGNENFFGKGAYIMVPLFTGLSFADFLTGRATVIQQDLTVGTRGLRMTEYGFYAQDKINVTRRLTLNIGLRYDLYPGHVEVADRLSNIDLIGGRVLFAGVDTSRNFVRTDKNNWAPRFGFAFAVNDKTAIRGGYGISYFNPFEQVRQAGLNPPFTRKFNLFNLDFTTVEAMYRFSDGLPVHLAPSVEDFDKENPSGSYRMFEPNSRSPYTQYFSFNIQRALPGQMVFDIGYVGTKGTKLPGAFSANPTPPGDPATAEQRRIHHATVPNVGDVEALANAFSSIYHSLQVKLEKRMSAGLQFLAAYTFGKSIDDASGGTITGGGDSNPSGRGHNPFDRRSDRARSSFDRAHRFVFAFNYDLPFGRGKAVGNHWRPVMNAVLGQWRINGILTLQSGLPFSVFAGSGYNCGCTVNDARADRIADGRLPADERSIHGWFDKSAFKDPPSSSAETAGRYGNAGRNIIPGPNFQTLDFSLFKMFKFTERVNLQFRAEFFNLLNRPNFLYPDQSNATWEAGGVITRAHDARIGQLALKLRF